MGGTRSATFVHTLATWTRFGLVAIAWLALAAIVALAGLAHTGLVDVAPYLVGPDRFPHVFDVADPAGHTGGNGD